MASDTAYEIRTLDRLIAVINNGDDGAQANEDLQKVLDTIAARVEQFGGKHKGALSLTITIEADYKGVDVSSVSVIKLPKRPVIKERLFLTERNSLTAKDPAKNSLFEGQDLGRRRGPVAE